MSDLDALAALARALDGCIYIYRDIYDRNADDEWVLVERRFVGWVPAREPLNPEGATE